MSHALDISQCDGPWTLNVHVAVELSSNQTLHFAPVAAEVYESAFALLQMLNGPIFDCQ